MNGLLITGKIVDMNTGKKIHKVQARSIEEFDEMFTKPMRDKLR